MTLPAPQPGMVIHFSYLWHHQAQRGESEGRKDRPCIVLLVTPLSNSGLRTLVLPVTHQPPLDGSGVSLPMRVKHHLGLDDQPSWAMTDQGNMFLWPGFDLRPRPNRPGQFIYGFLPPKLFEAIKASFVTHWRRGQTAMVER